jgi:hypothetical protein
MEWGGKGKNLGPRIWGSVRREFQNESYSVSSVLELPAGKAGERTQPQTHNQLTDSAKLSPKLQPTEWNKVNFYSLSSEWEHGSVCFFTLKLFNLVSCICSLWKIHLPYYSQIYMERVMLPDYFRQRNDMLFWRQVYGWPECDDGKFKDVLSEWVVDSSGTVESRISTSETREMLWSITHRFRI